MYSTYNQRKSVDAENSIRTLKSKIFKHLTDFSGNKYINALDDIANKYNNTVHRKMKMKPVDVTSDSYAEYNEDFNEKDPKFKVGDYVRISKYKIIFAKGYTQNWSEEFFVVSKIKKIIPQTYIISDLNGEPITGLLMSKDCRKQIKKNLEQKR